GSKAYVVISAPSDQPSPSVSERIGDVPYSRSSSALVNPSPSVSMTAGSVLDEGQPTIAATKAARRVSAATSRYTRSDAAKRMPDRRGRSSLHRRTQNPPKSPEKSQECLLGATASFGSALLRRRRTRDGCLCVATRRVGSMRNGRCIPFQL